MVASVSYQQLIMADLTMMSHDVTGREVREVRLGLAGVNTTNPVTIATCAIELGGGPPANHVLDLQTQVKAFENCTTGTLKGTQLPSCFNDSWQKRFRERSHSCLATLMTVDRNDLFERESRYDL